MRILQGWLQTNAALLTYVISASFLAIPFYRFMQIYGLTDNLRAVIAALVTFATSYAIFIFQNYGASITDGARRGSTHRRRLALPGLLADLPAADGPALVAVGTYALLLSWNEISTSSCCCRRRGA